jgi:hypothetical protein
MKGYEEEEMVGNLKELIDHERVLEAAKENLALRPDFNLADVFTLFDFTNSGVVRVTDL